MVKWQFIAAVAIATPVIALKVYGAVAPSEVVWTGLTPSYYVGGVTTSLGPLIVGTALYFGFRHRKPKLASRSLTVAVILNALFLAPSVISAVGRATV